ncbi:MAG TPA: heavy metal translocating P-type ATPase, partial [Acidaminococcaceae bacterium]|nr:heavy metal translocating P-type ATPase [Acidaminococcaceae bacterium]
MKEQGIALDAALADAYGEQGATVVFLAVDGKAAGLAALSDTLRESAAPMVRTLQNMHVASILLTGDNPAAAQHMAAKAGVSAVRSGLLPQDKQRIIREYQQAGHRVCMIGDGIN